MFPAAAALALLAAALLMFRTCGPCAGRSEREAADSAFLDSQAKRPPVKTGNKKKGVGETLPIEEDRDITEAAPKYEGPVDLGTRIEMITK